MINFLKYSGNKIKYVELINRNLITTKNVYVEPFVDSGSILFNLNRKFDQ